MQYNNIEIKNYLLKKITELNFLARQIEDITSLNGLNAKSDSAYITIVAMRSAFQQTLQHLEKLNGNKQNRYK